MRKISVARIGLIIAAMYSCLGWTAPPGIHLDAKLSKQKIGVHVSTGNPATLAVKARGPVINANVGLQSHSQHCLAGVEQIVPGVCVPRGPDGPVSPN